MDKRERGRTVHKRTRSRHRRTKSSSHPHVQEGNPCLNQKPASLSAVCFQLSSAQKEPTVSQQSWSVIAPYSIHPPILDISPRQSCLVLLREHCRKART